LQPERVTASEMAKNVNRCLVMAFSFLL